MKHSLRLASVADLPQITEIYNQAILERSATCDEELKSLEDRGEWFRQFDHQYPLLVAEVEGVVAAYGALMRYSPKSGYRFAVENSLYVHQDYRCQGLGRVLLQRLIHEAPLRGFTYVEARIFAHNSISRKLHESLGFELVGIQKAIANLDGKWYDNCIYCLHV